MATDEQVSSQEFVNANNLFAAAAYKEVQKRNKKNFIASPLSIEIALAFAQSGCEGETAQEIRKVLRLPDDKTKIEDEIKKFVPGLEGGDNYKLYCANKLYVLEKLPLKDGFKTAATEVFRADVENIDFKRKEEAAAKMNKWVEEKTNNKIEDIISPNDINKYTRVVILNALYFKSDWVIQFYIEDTIKSDFYINATDVVKVDTMHYSRDYKRSFPLSWSSELNAGFLELPFEGKNASMVIALPKERDGLAALESQLDQVLAPHNFRPSLLDIALPKFKVTSKIDFKEILKALGVKKAFDEERADLSGIAGEKGYLYISQVVQKSFIDVNEIGVEAAAATSVPIMVPLSLIRGPRRSFVVDHPFIFYIKINGAVVFVGRVTNPSL